MSNYNDYHRNLFSTHQTTKHIKTNTHVMEENISQLIMVDC